MVSIKKESGVTIQIKDNSSKKSRSFTVYGETKEKIYARLTFLYECIQDGKEVTIEK